MKASQIREVLHRRIDLSLACCSFLESFTRETENVSLLFAEGGHGFVVGLYAAGNQHKREKNRSRTTRLEANPISKILRR